MSDTLLNGVAVSGILFFARWFFVGVARVVAEVTGFRRRVERQVWREAFDTLQDPEWQAAFVREAKRYADDVAAALRPQTEPGGQSR